MNINIWNYIGITCSHFKPIQSSLKPLDLTKFHMFEGLIEKLQELLKYSVALEKSCIQETTFGKCANDSVNTAALYHCTVTEQSTTAIYHCTVTEHSTTALLYS